MNLSEELENAEARVLHLKNQLAGATCAEAGHAWKHIGGKNAGCGRENCGCSVPVHECTRCGDSDYGDNDDADQTVGRCLRDVEGA